MRKKEKKPVGLRTSPTRLLSVLPAAKQAFSGTNSNVFRQAAHTDRRAARPSCPEQDTRQVERLADARTGFCNRANLICA
jgi:hypothetical protein